MNSIFGLVSFLQRNYFEIHPYYCVYQPHAGTELLAKPVLGKSPLDPVTLCVDIVGQHQKYHSLTHHINMD